MIPWNVLSKMVSGAMVVFVIGCTSPRTGVEPQGETASPPPIVNAAPTGPPPGHVEPTNYWVREKIVLKSAPPPPAPQKTVVKKGKKSKLNKKASATTEALPAPKLPSTR
jgi:hypothetical protein